MYPKRSLPIPFSAKSSKCKTKTVVDRLDVELFVSFFFEKQQKTT